MLLLRRLPKFTLDSPLRAQRPCFVISAPIKTFIRSFHQSIASKAIPLKAASRTVPLPTQKKTLYPERLLVYHAGTGRTVFLGCLKVTTIFIFIFFSFVAAPKHFFAQEQPLWVTGGVLLSGLIPLLTINYMTSPFVTYIHLRIPPYARNSRDLLLRFSRHVSATAELDVTTMNFVGKPRVARMQVSELRPARRRFGLVNFVRDTRGVERGRRWWMGRSVGAFGVHSVRANVREGVVWENVKVALEKNRRG